MVGYHLEILNNLIFEFMFCKLSLMGQWSICSGFGTWAHALSWLPPPLHLPGTSSCWLPSSLWQTAALCPRSWPGCLGGCVSPLLSGHRALDRQFGKDLSPISNLGIKLIPMWKFQCLWRWAIHYRSGGKPMGRGHWPVPPSRLGLCICIFH